MLHNLLVDGLLAAALLLTASGAARGESQPADADASNAVAIAPASTARTASQGEDQQLRLDATWGQLSSSQLEHDTPVAFWSVDAHAPLIESIGMSVQLRFDSPVFGDPRNPFSLFVQPGRTEYNLALRVAPPGWPAQAEYHHVSGHEVEPVQGQGSNVYEAEVRQGGASNFGSLILHVGRGDLRVGYGSVWTDTNTAPMLLDLAGILLNSRAGRGPFTAIAVPVPGPMGAVGRAGAFYLHDTQGGARYSGDVLAWGAAWVKRLGRRVGLGASYLGNNGTPGLKRGNSSATLFLQLSWPGFAG